VTPISGMAAIRFAGQSAGRPNVRKLDALLAVAVVGVLSFCAPGPDQRAAPEPDSTLQAVNDLEEVNGVVGQTVYVPVYSHIYSYDKKRVIDLAATLSIRNTDEQHPIRLDSVRYFDSEGKLLREHLDQPARLGPMASTDFVVEQRDTAGGSGANFIVEWVAGEEVTPPVIESVMIGASSQQGISFVSTGRVIRERSREVREAVHEEQ
jgi:hypothetical protein